jgi:hypothetical protein
MITELLDDLMQRKTTQATNSIAYELTYVEQDHLFDTTLPCNAMTGIDDYNTQLLY